MNGLFEIVLYQPEIPPNTGNIMRLCANTGCRLHLVHPLGFSLREKLLKRAGLDYLESVDITQHTDWQACRLTLAGRRLFALSTRGTRCYDEPGYRDGDVFVFGPETRGLPAEVIAEFPLEHRIRVPMSEESRSLNLSNAAAVVVYEAWRQLGFQSGS